MELKFQDPPCKIDDVIFMNYSFDNLHKFLNFLLITDKEAHNRLHDISIKLIEIDYLRQDITETTDRVLKCEVKSSDLETIIDSHKENFKEIDMKFVSNIKVKNDILIIIYI